METLHFSTHINAPAEKVWDVMLSDATYRDWTQVFNPSGSHFEGDWKEGSTMRFVGPNEEGGSDGMVSRIKENREHAFISIEHLGVLHNGVEDRVNETWAGAHENYTFTEIDGGTRLDIDIDVAEPFKDMFEEQWPQALARLKEIAEK